MHNARGRIVDDFPTPIAYTDPLIFDEALASSIRRWSLCYCEYQLLRTVALPLVGQYVRTDLSAIDFVRDKANDRRFLETSLPETDFSGTHHVP